LANNTALLGPELLQGSNEALKSFYIMAALFRCYFRHDATFYANSVKFGDTKGWDYSSAKRHRH
jgi:hypothetical protein